MWWDTHHHHAKSKQVCSVTAVEVQQHQIDAFKFLRASGRDGIYHYVPPNCLRRSAKILIVINSIEKHVISARKHWCSRSTGIQLPLIYSTTAYAMDFKPQQDSGQSNEHVIWLA